MEAERERIRGQVHQFLEYLAGVDNQIVRDHLGSLETVAATLRQMMGNQDLQVCIDMFCQRFITPGNDVEIAEWHTVRMLQFIMMAFILDAPPFWSNYQ